MRRRIQQSFTAIACIFVYNPGSTIAADYHERWQLTAMSNSNACFIQGLLRCLCVTWDAKCLNGWKMEASMNIMRQILNIL